MGNAVSPFFEIYPIKYQAEALFRILKIANFELGSAGCWPRAELQDLLKHQGVPHTPVRAGCRFVICSIWESFIPLNTSRRFRWFLLLRILESYGFLFSNSLVWIQLSRKWFSKVGAESIFYLSISLAKPFSFIKKKFSFVFLTYFLFTPTNRKYSYIPAW